MSISKVHHSARWLGCAQNPAGHGLVTVDLTMPIFCAIGGKLHRNSRDAILDIQ
jgi:hypothetical protein